MEPVIAWASASRVEQGATRDFELDLAYGTGEATNDFELTLPADVELSAGSLVNVDGTGWGGIVDGVRDDTTASDRLTWFGRSWQGVLARKVLCPASGASYITESGTAAACVADVISRCSLGGLFAVGECASATISHQMARYCSAWEGLLAMLASAGLRPTFSVDRTGGTVTVLVGAAVRDADTDADADLMDFTVEARWRPTNHLVCLGSGELSSRLVTHLYADSSGNVSTTQTLTGPNEVTEVYDYPNCDDATELAESGTQRLEEMQVGGKVDVSLSDGIESDVGDVLTAVDTRLGLTVDAEIGVVVVKINNGVVSVSRESGTSKATFETRRS